MNRDSQVAGQELLEKAEAYELQHRVTFSEAMRAVAADPANASLARAWNGIGVAAGGHGQEAGELVVTRAEEHAERTGCDFAEAVHRTLQADHELARAYHAGEPYRGGSLTGRPVHYGQLSEVEKGRHLPLRRLAPGERRVEGRTYVAKMADPSVGGGMFQVGA